MVAAWCLGVTPDSGSGGASDSSAHPWDPSPLTGLPHPAFMGGFGPCLIVSCAVFNWCPGRPFWRETEVGEEYIWEGGEGKWEGWRED